VKRLASIVMIAGVFALGALSASGDVIFRDDWNDLTVHGPALARPGVDWVRASGGFSANASTWEYPPSGFFGMQSGTLMFAPNTVSAISVDFGPTVPGTPVEARFKLQQSNGAENGNYRFVFGFKNTVSGNSYYEHSALNPAYYGSSGFQTYDPGMSLGAGAAGKALRNGWNYIKMSFDPSGYIQVWHAVDSAKTKAYDDPSLAYTMVAPWYNYAGLASIDRFHLSNDGAAVSWKVDDVEIDASIDTPADTWALRPDAVQTIYRTGVPHTDKNGNMMLAYDPSTSFFPIMLYHAWIGTMHLQTWTFSDFADAGYNSCHLWEGQRPTVAIANAAHAAGIQLMTHWPTNSEINALKNHPATLAWYLDEEPTGSYWSGDMQSHYQTYLNRKSEVKALDPQHPVFIIDVPWITPPATNWWTIWNSAGDITSHDNYPIYSGTSSISGSMGIPETVSLAVSVNNESKPMWFTAQSFSADWGGWALPTIAQERCMIYTSIIHGATGIIQFVLDSFVARAGGCLGIAPNPIADYGGPDGRVVTSSELRASRGLWYAVQTLNAELSALRPAILSPTSSEPYEVYVDRSMTPVTWNSIKTLLKTDPAGGLTLLLANVDGVAQRARVRFPDKIMAIQELYGTIGFTRTGDYIEFSCPAWDSRVLRLFEIQSISGVKNQADGTLLACSGIVSAVFGDSFYIETADRNFGIRVNKANSNLMAGQIVNVAGSITTLSNHERCIVPGSVEQTDDSGTIEPLAMNNKALGGGPMGLQSGVQGGVGLNNIGLLIQTSGKIVARDASATPQWFTIDDGSGATVTVYGTVPTGMPYVSVTGISSCEKDGAAIIRRVIRATSIQTM